MNTIKTLLVAILLSVTGAAQAAPIANFSFNGQFMLFDGAGTLFDDGSDHGFTGVITLDMSTGSGTASIAPTSPDPYFFGAPWSVHDFTLQATGPDTLHADLFFYWVPGMPIDTHITLDYSVGLDGLGGYTLTTMDCGFECDGIPGTPVDNGPLFGANFTFDGTAAILIMQVCPASEGVDCSPPPVPLPPAAWLLGSGLLGLIGVARRKAA